ncbi:MAG: hypothetical protein ACK5IC_04880 [Moheibacter sp.]
MLPETQISTTVYRPEEKYSVMYRFHTVVKKENTQSKKTPDNHYIRKVKIKYLGMIGENYVHQFLTLEDQMEGPFDTLLLRKLSSIFDELLVQSDVQGTINSVLNIPHLKKRFKEIKTKLKKNHGGSVLENYYLQIDKILANEELLIQFLSEKRMLGLVFNGLWKLEENENTIIKQKEETVTVKRDKNDFQEIYIYKNNRLQEASAMFNQINHNLLCLGSEKSR